MFFNLVIAYLYCVCVMMVITSILLLFVKASVFRVFEMFEMFFYSIKAGTLAFKPLYIDAVYYLFATSITLLMIQRVSYLLEIEND